MKYRYKYPKADHTVDAVVFRVILAENSLKILLIERASDPFQGHWALPGGFIELDESLEQAAKRELEEETGVRLSHLEQLYTFGRPDRDPRGRVISTAYLGLIQPNQVDIKGGSDAARAAWRDVNKLPKLAFDHARIVDIGLERLRSKMRCQPVGIELLPREFTLTDLQRVHEIILNTQIDKRNFRRKVQSFGVLATTGRTRSQNHRPAQLYRFDKKQYKMLRKQGIDFKF